MFESSKVLEDCAKDRESGGNPSTKSTTTPQSSTPLGATSTTSGATPPPQSANSDRPFTDSVVSRDDETDRNEGNSCREEGERRVDGDDMLGKSPPWRPTARELSADERAEAKEAFVMFDLEATGKLRLRPLKMAFRALGIKVPDVRSSGGTSIEGRVCVECLPLVQPSYSFTRRRRHERADVNARSNNAIDCLPHSMIRWVGRPQMA